MPIQIDELKKLLLDSFPKSEVVIEDLKGDGDHYSVTIKSEKFKGISRIEQHKMVYSALQGKMGNALHALMIKTKTE